MQNSGDSQEIVVISYPTEDVCPEDKVADVLLGG